jgi:transposase InsO family protein
MDFRIVATVSFQLLYVWFLIDHGRRRLIHFKVTTNPNARWVIQLLREAFPGASTPRYLHLDRDSIFSAEVVGAIRGFGIDPVRRSPWQNAIAERRVGTCRREPLDHVIVFGEGHLRRLLADYVAYYNTERVHTGLGDSPDGRSIEPRPSSTARVVALPPVGGLYHRYVWAEAAQDALGFTPRCQNGPADGF